MKTRLIFGIMLLLAVLVISCQDEQSLEFDRYYSSGALVYQSRCQNCHGAKGEGLGGLIPPLTDSIYLKKNRDLLPCLVKNGLRGKIIVAKKEFEERMQPTNLSPIEIAEVVTYVTNSFGNKLGALTIDKVNEDIGKCR